ncbi:c-type cytochrome [Roseateles cellulosilyticus]|uniref:Cytochrome c n=1 Tax=Pelomonas cellulosilytica TaxID=2906762 RepID=A0ABS8XMI1_9BURK|nr:cytochrome c [Pelomonas sp. P8]MCE4553989.1 cytochrome c [Pelomonas sp. P8]
MKTILSVPAAMLLTLSAAAPAQAQQAPKPEQLIKWRQSAYQVIAWNTGRVKANVDGSYNKEDAQRAANTIAAVANGGLPGLFATGTESGKGWHDTTAKPSVFSDAAGFGTANANFAKEANELARVAQGGDVAAVKAQLAALQKTCKACHDDFRNSN